MAEFRKTSSGCYGPSFSSSKLKEDHEQLCPFSGCHGACLAHCHPLWLEACPCNFECQTEGAAQRPTNESCWTRPVLSRELSGPLHRDRRPPPPDRKPLFRDRDRGGSNVPNARGGELAPNVAPWRLGLLTPKSAIFCRIFVERDQFQGSLEIQDFHLLSNFRRFEPPYPGLQPNFCCVKILNNVWPVFAHPFFPLLAPLFLPFSRHFFALSPPSKSALLCRQVSGCASPQSSGRKFLPEICATKGQNPSRF